PTVVLGSTIVSNLATNPGIDPTKTPYAIGYSLAGTTSLDTCDIKEGSIELNRQGGTFDLTFLRNVSVPSRLSPMPVMGLRGTVLDTGKLRGDQSVNTVHGVFGDSLYLDKQIILMAQDNPLLRGLVPQSPIASNQSNNWATVSAAAEAIAISAGLG